MTHAFSSSVEGVKRLLLRFPIEQKIRLLGLPMKNKIAVVGVAAVLPVVLPLVRLGLALVRLWFGHHVHI